MSIRNLPYDFFARCLDAISLPSFSLVILWAIVCAEDFRPVYYVFTTISFVSFGLISILLPPYGFYLQYVNSIRLVSDFFKDIFFVILVAVLIISVSGTGDKLILAILISSGIFINIDYILSILDKKSSSRYRFWITSRFLLVILGASILLFLDRVLTIAVVGLGLTLSILCLRVVSISELSSLAIPKLDTIAEKYREFYAFKKVLYPKYKLIIFNFLGVIVANIDVFVLGVLAVKTESRMLDFAIILRVVSAATTMFTNELLLSFLKDPKFNVRPVVLGLIIISGMLGAVFTWSLFHPEPPPITYILSFGFSILAIPLVAQLMQLGKINLLIGLQIIFTALIGVLMLNLMTLGTVRLVGFAMIFFVSLVCFLINVNEVKEARL